MLATGRSTRGQDPPGSDCSRRSPLPAPARGPRSARPLPNLELLLIEEKDGGAAPISSAPDGSTPRSWPPGPRHPFEAAAVVSRISCSPCPPTIRWRDQDGRPVDLGARRRHVLLLEGRAETRPCRSARLAGALRRAASGPRAWRRFAPEWWPPGWASRCCRTGVRPLRAVVGRHRAAFGDPVPRRGAGHAVATVSVFWELPDLGAPDRHPRHRGRRRLC